MKITKWLLLLYTAIMIFFYVAAPNKNSVLSFFELVFICILLSLTFSAFKYVEPIKDPTYDENAEIQNIINEQENTNG